MVNQIYKIWKDKETNTYNIELEQRKYKTLVDQLSRINKSFNVSHSYVNLDEDFSNLIGWHHNGTNYDESYKNWRIVFDQYPEKWIGSIKPKIIRRIGFGSGTVNSSASIKENYVIGVTDISGSSLLKKVTVDVGIAIYDSSGVQDDFEVKMALKLILPQLTV